LSSDGNKLSNFVHQIGCDWLGIDMGKQETSVLAPFKLRLLSEMEIKLFKNEKVCLSGQITIAARLCSKYKVYHSKIYRFTKKSCSYLIYYEDDTKITQYAQVLYFFEYDSKCYAFVQPFKNVDLLLPNVDFDIDFNASDKKCK
jgi:hypothetical protein